LSFLPDCLSSRQGDPRPRQPRLSQGPSTPHGSTGSVTTIGALALGGSTRPRAINSNGHVVGYSSGHAVLRSGGVLSNLNDLIPSATGVEHAAGCRRPWWMCWQSSPISELAELIDDPATRRALQL